ncbi:peptide-methionine (S)-S-oxide reductase MsrA [Algibacter pacificus]|uniref:peptide-methionine (S)-S-oxide reductase MsrA n=1 Tax=Algibacter pacificus TaxID=2599389 RepID=UPI0011CC904F|nr:peptide-methionine (S)-S-oxide reductase MsrA [Algibacter pacificus]
MKHIIPILAVALLFSCQNTAQTKKTKKQIETLKPVEVPIKNGKARAYFASGCFWCVEAIFESVIGVEESISGYSGGHTKNPTYEASNTGKTGHAEAVEVIYDPNIITFDTLVDVYFGSQNVTQVNGQGNDRGSQYRSIIFYQNETQKQIVLKKKSALAKKLGVKIAAEVYPFQKFWKAEDYHQNYERLHPDHPYIKNVSVPRLNRFKSKFPNLIKHKH